MAKPRRTQVTTKKLVGPDGAEHTLVESRTSAGSFGRGFLIMWQDVLADLARDPEAGAGEYRVFLWAVSGGLTWRGWKQIRQVDLAEKLSLSLSTTSTALRWLLKRGLLMRQGAGPRQEWRLPTNAGWRGSVPAYQARRKEELEGARAMLARAEQVKAAAVFDVDLPGLECEPAARGRYSARERGDLFATYHRRSLELGPSHEATLQARAEWDKSLVGVSERRKRAALAEARKALGLQAVS
jgi:hypothetical protein